MNMPEYQRKWLIRVCGILLILASEFICPARVLSSDQERFYSIHATSYQRKSGAVSDVNRFQAMGQEAFYHQSEVPGKGTWYRVYIGRFAEKSEAHQHGEELKSKAVLSYYSIQKFDAPARESKPVQPQAVVKPEKVSASEPAFPESGIQETNPLQVQPPDLGDAESSSPPVSDPVEPNRAPAEKSPDSGQKEPDRSDSGIQKTNPLQVQPPDVDDAESLNPPALDNAEMNKVPVENTSNTGQPDSRKTNPDIGPAAGNSGLSTDTMFEEALKAFESSNYQGALEILTAMESSPSDNSHRNERISRCLADCYYFLAPQKGNSYFLIATERYKKILLEYPDRPQNADGFYRLGKSFENLKFYYEALEAYRLLIVDFPDTVYAAEAGFKIGEMLHKTGRFDQAIDQLKSWQRLYPDDIHAKTAAFLIADSYYQLRQAVNAENRYREAMQRWPDYGDIDLELLLNMGKHHDQNRRYADAAHVFSLAASMHPDDACISDTLCTLGRILQDSGRLQGAFAMFGLVQKTYPETADQAARLLADMGMLNPGMRVFGFAGADVYLDPVGTYDHLIAKSRVGEQTAVLMAKKADTLRNTGKLARCVDAYSELLERFPSGPHEEESRYHLKTVVQTLVPLLFQEGKDLAVADLYLKTYGRGLIHFDEQDVDTGLMLGTSLNNIGLPQAANTIYSELRGICRNKSCSGPVALGEARADAEVGRKQEASEGLLALIADPVGLTAGQMREAKILAADILYDLKRYREAADFYGEALNDDSKAPENRVCLQYAAALRHAGKIDASFGAYRKIVERFMREDDTPRSQWVEAYVGLGQCCYLQKRYDDGVAFFEKALVYSDATDRAWTLHQLIIGLLQMNDKFAAEKRLTELRQTDAFWAQAAQRWIEESSWRETNQQHLE